jgi:hypothetical protein
LDEVMEQVHRRIGTAVLTGLRLEPAGLGVVPGSVVPARLPDLFADAPLVVLGRYRGRSSGAVAVQAREAAGGMWLESIEGRTESGAALASVWARGRLRELEDRYVTGGDRAGLEREIVDTSLRFGVLCRFTAYGAVDHSAVVNPGGQGHSIVQPVEQPEGWNAQAAGAVRGVLQPCMVAPACAPQAIDRKGEIMASRAAKRTQLAVDDAARPAAEEAERSSAGLPPLPAPGSGSDKLAQPCEFDLELAEPGSGDPISGVNLEDAGEEQEAPSPPAAPATFGARTLSGGFDLDLARREVLLGELAREVGRIVPPGPDMVTMGKLPQTPRVKLALEFAIEEARSLNHDFVGPEHLLLGLLRVPDCTAARTLVNLGADLEEIRRQVLRLLKPGGREEGKPAAPLTREAFTDPARRVMQLANQEAQRFNHEYIDTHHILLALLREGTGIVASVLANLGRRPGGAQAEAAGPGVASGQQREGFWK